MDKDYHEKKKEMATSIARGLYSNNLIKTIFNTPSEKHRKEGWTLKNNDWSPYFVNLREIGAHPSLLRSVGTAMAWMYDHEMSDCTGIVGIEMAGIPIASATTTSAAHAGVEIPLFYTRALPELFKPTQISAKVRRGVTDNLSYISLTGKKVREPRDAEMILERSDLVGTWGQKSYLEGILHAGDNLVLVDDLVTNLGSKLIAREIVNYEAERQGFDVKCDHIIVVLDREQGAAKAAEENGMHLHSLFGMREVVELLRYESMSQGEYEIISEYLDNSKKFQSKAEQTAALLFV